MVKAYYYNYRTVSTDSYDNFLIASNEDEAKEIALKRIGMPENKIEYIELHETSLENARVEDLTAGDLVRLWTCQN